MAATEGKKVTLTSSDKETFVVDEAVAMESQTIKHMIEDDCADSAIPLPNVDGKTLSIVIEYCKKHVESRNEGENNKSSEEDLTDWDAEFVNVDQTTLYSLILAANYLEITGLLDLTCKAVAEMIKGKTTEQIRQTLNIKNDFTPEEEKEMEEEIRREYELAFE